MKPQTLPAIAPEVWTAAQMLLAHARESIELAAGLLGVWGPDAKGRMAMLISRVGLERELLASRTPQARPSPSGASGGDDDGSDALPAHPRRWSPANGDTH